MTRVCTKCGAEKPLEDFYKNRNSRDGRAYSCKECRKAYQRGRYDPETQAGRMKTWRTKNPDKVKGYSRAQYAREGDLITRRAAAWCRAHPEKRAKISKDYDDRQKFFGAIAAIGAVNEKLGLK